MQPHGRQLSLHRAHHRHCRVLVEVVDDEHLVQAWHLQRPAPRSVGPMLSGSL